MPTTTTITKAQRDGIYELVCNHLYGIEDLWVALGRSRDYATAERLGIEFGRNLAYCRKRAKFSQEELAVRASLHRTAVGQLERGERVARVDTVVKLAGSLGIPPGELLDGMGWNPGGTRLGQFTAQDALPLQIDATAG